MICISIAQASRRFVLADMYNAAPQCDLIELRLDRFEKAPELGDMISAAPKPLIFSCRRRQDGGEWTGSEDERLALLRQCIVSKADYVEIELDVADQVRKFPPTKRVISYTNLQETPADLAEIYAEAQKKGADIVKLTTRVRTPEEAWPLLQILAKPSVPTVGVGLGRPGLMLAILGQKVGAPWTYAALERGMESYPLQPTVSELTRVYRFADVGRATPLFGVTGFGDRERALSMCLNAAFVGAGRRDRCLPLEVGDVKLFRKVIGAVKLTGVAVDLEHQAALMGIANQLDADAMRSGAVDVLLQRDGLWHGHYTLGRAAAAGLEAAVAGEGGLAKQRVMVVGVNAAARAVAWRVHEAGGGPIIASRDHDAARKIAAEVGGRFTPLEGTYTVGHEVLVLCSEERQPGAKVHADELPIHAGHLKPGLTLLDLTTMPHRSALVREAEQRGCKVVSPKRVFLTHAAFLARLLVGHDIPPEPLREAVREFTADEE